MPELTCAKSTAPPAPGRGQAGGGDNGDKRRDGEPKPYPPDKPAPKPVKEPGRSPPEVDDPERRVPQRTTACGDLVGGKPVAIHWT